MKIGEAVRSDSMRGVALYDGESELVFQVIQDVVRADPRTKWTDRVVAELEKVTFSGFPPIEHRLRHDDAERVTDATNAESHV